MDEARPCPIEAEPSTSALRLVFPDSTWTVSFPPGWRPVATGEQDLWSWEMPDVASSRLRLRRHPRVQWEVDVVNLSPDVAMVDTPVAAVSTSGTLVPWFAGSAGEVVVALPESTIEWSQRRGSCSGDASRVSLFPDPCVLRAGQAASAAWLRQELPAGALPPAPAFVPRQRYLPFGQVLEVQHSDAALLGAGLDVTTTGDGSEVLGGAGLHTLSFLDARGTALVEVGWFPTLGELAASALAQPRLPSGLRAWLLAAAPGEVGDVDQLDVALADALEYPDVWGVLAGMRAAALTDLPVADDVSRAASQVWDAEADDAARRLLVAHALVYGWEPAMVLRWLRSAGPVVSPHVQQVLGSVRMGRITSEPVDYGGRDVALASLWVAAHAESAEAAEWEMAVATARSRLMCHLSLRTSAVDVAWLVAGALLD